MIAGSDVLFGNWDIKKGVWMTPHHEGEHLMWQAQVSVPEGFKLDYRFGIVDEKLNIIKWESGEPRHLALPAAGPPDGAVIDVLDGWQVYVRIGLLTFIHSNSWSKCQQMLIGYGTKKN